MEFYGDKTRWFVADVIDATPPYGLEGRVKVRIHGTHSPSTREIRQSDLPWAQVVLPTTEGGVSGLGSTPNVQAGALAFGFFMDGKDSQVPLIIGTIPRIETPSRIQQGLSFDSIIDRAQNEQFYETSLSRIDESEDELSTSSFGGIFEGARSKRKAVAVKFFLTNGYTLKQSVSIVAAMDYESNMDNTNLDPETERYGIGGWKGQRLVNLKNFSNKWVDFTVQLSFVLYELNTTKAKTNIKLLNIDSIDNNDKNNCQRVVAKQYMDYTIDEDITSVVNIAIEYHDELVG